MRKRHVKKNNIGINYYVDPNGGQTLTSSEYMDNKTYVDTPDGMFTLTISATKTLKTRNLNFKFSIDANPNKIKGNVYTQTKNIDVISENEEAPKVYNEYQDMKISSMFSYDKYHDDFKINVEIDSQSHYISDYEYYFCLTFAGNDYKFRLF